jgi:uncharacterized protein (TIGR00661 family)
MGKIRDGEYPEEEEARMRIVYGVFGYGRGHATRAMSVLPELLRRHEVLLCAGGDALLALSGSFDVEPIPTLRYVYDRAGRISTPATLRANAPALLDLFGRGETFRRLVAHVAAFRPDVAICDAEPWTHRAALQLGVPRIGFDHFGVLVHGRPRVPLALRLELFRDVAAYRTLIPTPARAIVSSFYRPPVISPRVRWVGCLLRDEVMRVKATRGEHLLVYLNQGAQLFTPRIEVALRGLRMPVVVYGTDRRDTDGDLDFRAPANLAFVEDLARARAVLSTAGNQLVGEALHFGKPMLVVPEPTVEQQVNAAGLLSIGAGDRALAGELTTARLLRFFADEERHAEAARKHAGDGRRESLAALERFARELVPAARRRAATRAA